MYEDIKQPSFIKEPSFIAKHSKKIATTIGLMFVLLIITILASTSDAATVSSEEIEQNAIEWKELQKVIDEQENIIQEAQKVRVVTLEQQDELEQRNSLLRKVFTPGENQ